MGAEKYENLMEEGDVSETIEFYGHPADQEMDKMIYELYHKNNALSKDVKRGRFHTRQKDWFINRLFELISIKQNYYKKNNKTT